MSIITYLKDSFSRKKARRVFQNYGYRIDKFLLDKDGEVEYANWLNPLVQPKIVTQKEVDFFKKVISKNSLAIDIGANTGDLTVPMAIAADAGSLVLALDPNPQVFSILEANAALNQTKGKIVPLPFAATENDSEFYFASSEASFSNGALVNEIEDKSHGNHKLKQKVKGVNLENYLVLNYAEWIPKISFVKVDTEGHDLSVLKTLSTIIAQYKPIVVAEVFPTLTQEERKEMFLFFKGYQYHIYDISHFDLNSGIDPVLLNNENDMTPFGTASNILAMQEEWKG